MAINLDILANTPNVNETLQKGYLFKDIVFDLDISFTQGDELYRAGDKQDLTAIYDAAAVINSVKNILTTMPGQKILSPLFGIDLRQFLFEPATETRAFFIGQLLQESLPQQEPRVSIDKINIGVRPDDQEYIIDLAISIPSLNVYNISLKGVLNNDGYTFV